MTRQSAWMHPFRRMRLLHPSIPAISPRSPRETKASGAPVRSLVDTGNFGRPLWALVCVLFCYGLSSAQPPGTDPPADVFPAARSTTDGAPQDELPIRAFMFLSESDSPVMMPGMTWEELERLQNLDFGIEVPTQAFSYEEMEISGEAAERRAELSVTLKIAIDSTDGRWVPIPLRMGNFHRLAPPDVSGVEEYFMTLKPDRGGYLLWVKTKARRNATLQMRVSARVDTTSAQSLEFQLPDVAAKVKLVTDGRDVSGDIIGQGYDTIEPKELPGGRTEFLIESVGGTFTVRWGRRERDRDDVPELEVDSRITMNWGSPQEAPRASVQLTVRNVQDAIDALEIRLPPGSNVPEDASLGVDGQSVQFGPPIPDPDGERRAILIPEQERQTRIDLNFSYNVQLPGGSISASRPLRFQVPEVVGALRHRGEITVQTGTDFRLRWNAEPGVRSVFGESVDDATSGRSYLFKFDRGSFELPLWLSAKERQVRVNATSQISFLDSTATLDMLIRSSDRASDGRGPQIDMADWSIESIENAMTEEPIDVFQGDGYPEIDFPAGSGEPPPIRIRAQQTFDPTQELIVISVPRIVKTDDGLLVPTSTVEIVNSGRSMLIVDMEASENLERIVSPNENASDSVSRFRVDSHESTALLVGTMVDQPPRITLACDGTVLLDGNQLQTTINWTVTSDLDLEGALPIRVPELPPTSRRANDGSAELSTANGAAPSQEDLSQLWSVTVGGLPAALQRVNDSRFDLVSPRLATGTIAIRFTRTQTVSPTAVGDSIESLPLPRPAIEGVTIRGTINVSLRGTGEMELLSAVSPATNEIVLDSLPPDPLRLRLRSRQTLREELSINRVVLRTNVGRNTRHEQVLANVQGGDSFRVRLPANIGDVSVEGLIDGQKQRVRRDGDVLMLPLPGDQTSHVVDLRIWVQEESESLPSVIEPTLRLPVEVGRVYWQIVVPQDNHLVWASPTMGRSMTWSFDGWRLGRLPSHDDRALTALIGATPHLMSPGNPYLYVGSDVRSFRVVTASRVVLWVTVGLFVLLSSLMLTHLPRTRHPLTAVFAATLFAGLLAIAPDAAVLAGQLAVIALVLVIIMIAVRSLVAPRRSDRILTPRDGRRRADNSTHSLPTTQAAERRSSVSQTQSIPPSPTEASP